jgi:hypothetical protein
MQTVRAILKQITLTNILLLAIAVFLYLNWTEMRKISEGFGWMNHLLSDIDIDLTR